MSSPSDNLKTKVRSVLADLSGVSRPSRQQLVESAAEIREWRLSRGTESAWPFPVRLATATIDDGFGHGIALIGQWADALGATVIPLGLLLSPEAIIKGCTEHRPHLLGITVLQFDTEEAVRKIHDGIAPTVRIIAGGPLFNADPEMAERAGIDAVFRDAPAFAAYLLNFRPDEIAT